MEQFIDLRNLTPHPVRLKCVWEPGVDRRLECRWVPDREPDAEVNPLHRKAKPVRKGRPVRTAS